MVKPPTFDSNGMKKGAWSKEEDEILRAYVAQYGHANWRLLPSSAGLARCGKSCRLRWVNYLKPGLKKGKFTKQEEEFIIKLHSQIGNKWSTMAAKMPGRTDNEIKNYWHAHIKKRFRRVNAPNLKEENQDQDRESSSSETNSCVTNDDHQEESGEDPKNIDALINPTADSYSSDSSNQTILSQLNLDLPPFDVKEELRDFEMFTEMQNDLWFDSFGDEILDMVLW